MRINAIFNENEIWFPEYVVKAGQNRKLNYKELIVPEGILIPNGRFLMYYRALQSKTIDTDNVNDLARIDIISPARVLGMYRTSKYLGLLADVEHITSGYRVIGDVDGGVDFSIAANYMFDTGRLKTPKQLLTKLRKHFHNDIPFLRYDLDTLFKEREDTFGKIVPLPTEWGIKSDKKE